MPTLRTLWLATWALERCGGLHQRLRAWHENRRLHGFQRGLNVIMTAVLIAYCCAAPVLLLLQITYQEALAAAFVEGWIFIAISLTGVRGRLVSLVPKCLMLATAGGIGLFLAL